VTSGRNRIRRGRRPLRARAAGPVSLAPLALAPLALAPLALAPLALALLALAVLALAGCGTAGYGAPVAPIQMSVSGGAFVSGSLAPRYTCQGAGINPPLNWSAAPPGTKSLALIVDDSSAPITPFIYWLVFDINPGATDIQEGSLPTGARQALNSARHASYDAPCPAGHRHSYRFTVYALSTTLNLPNGAPLQAVWTAIAAATIGRGRIVVSGSP
jgi:Raf kinase inhibitor-like YbhB/YbcL family protein